MMMMIDTSCMALMTENVNPKAPGAAGPAILDLREVGVCRERRGREDE